MSYEKRDNSGTLGANKRREKDSHPTHAGAARIGGVDYWVSAWVKTNNDSGERFFSLSFKPKDDRVHSPGQTAISQGDDISDEIPF